MYEFVKKVLIKEAIILQKVNRIVISLCLTTALEGNERDENKNRNYEQCTVY